MPTLGERLRKLRVIKGLTQKDAASQLGMSDARYNQYENDRRSPDYETLKKIAIFYKVSTDYILSNTDEKIEALAKKSNDVRDIMEELRNELITQKGLMFDGEPLTEDALRSILDAMELGMEFVQKSNKKYASRKRKADKNNL